MEVKSALPSIVGNIVRNIYSIPIVFFRRFFSSNGNNLNGVFGYIAFHNALVGKIKSMSFLLFFLERTVGRQGQAIELTGLSPQAKKKLSITWGSNHLYYICFTCMIEKSIKHLSKQYCLGSRFSRQMLPSHFFNSFPGH